MTGVPLARNAIVFGAFIAIWWLAVLLFRVPSFILPAPNLIAPKLVFLAEHASLAIDILVTLEEIVLGFALGAGAGIGCGLLFFASPRLERLASPLVLLVQTAPKIALAPLLLLWLGLGAMPKIVLVAIIVAFPALLGTLAGLKSIDSGFHDLGIILRLTPMQKFWRIDLPFAAPSILASLRVSTTQAVTAAVIGELMGANRGLGYLLEAGQESNDTAIVIAIVLLLSLLGWAFYELISLVERHTLAWHQSALRDMGG